MNQISDEISFLRKELNKKDLEIENNNKLIAKVLREKDVSLKYNNELRNQLELLSAKLHLHQNVVKTITNSVETQTDLSLIADNYNNKDMICCQCLKSMTSSGNDLNNTTIASNSWKQNSETNNTRISDLVRETAEEVVLKNNIENDYYYDQKSKTYYSRSSGWYYYPDRYLFYDPNTQNYYKYDSEKKVYNFYSSLQQQSDHKRENITQSSKAKKSKKDTKDKQEDNEGFTNTPMANSDVETISISSEEEGEIETSDDDSNKSELICEDKTDCGPPLVRLIVKESSTLEIGSLLIVTCMGAKIGNKSNCDVWITDESVSKLHAEIKYNEIDKNYVIKDLNSTNGTFSNGIKIESNQEIVLKHYDEITFGECLLLVHIHNGRDVTCDNCEPGLVMANLKSSERNRNIDISHKHRDREKDRRKNLKHLKKKYGLSDDGFCEVKVMTTSSYKDRALERRKEKGSDNPYEKTAAGTSIDKALTNSNKGFKILEKMGWTAGKPLGRHQNGNTEPILMELRDNRSGLGYQQNSDNFMIESNKSKTELKSNKKCD